MNVSEKERQWLLTLADMTPEERDLYLDKQIENSSATDGGGGDSTLDVMIDDFWLWIFIPIWIVMVYFIGLWIGKLEGGVEIDVAAFEGANPPPGDVPQFEAWSAK